MADKFQTQCPHCGVKFQITAQQLSLAGGNVRCGSCLQVFQASSHLVPLGGTASAAGTAGSARTAGATATARPSAATPTRPAPAPSPATPAAATGSAANPASNKVAASEPLPPDVADDDLADMILQELENPAPPPPPPPPPARAPRATAVSDGDDLADMILRELEENPPAAVPPPPSAGRQANAAPDWSLPAPGNAPAREQPRERLIDDELADDGLIDDTPSERANAAMPGDKRRPGGGKAIVNADEEDVFGASANTLLENVEEPIDESWAKELIGEKVEDEKDALVRKFTEIKADNLAIAATESRQKSALQERIARLERGEADLAPSPLARNAPGDSGLDGDDLDFLNDNNLSLQDVELPGIQHPSEYDTAGMAHEVAWGRETFWGALSAVFLLVLLGQYMIFNFDTLARDEAWRGVYAITCGAIGCELPGESDVSRIQGANLVVRSHPRLPGALIVDTVVYNRATFAQPFPDLELSFSDSSGNLLAGRVFRPEEYLKGELDAHQLMPPDTPVHLSLELMDPGTDAVNYELRFLPSTNAS